MKAMTIHDIDSGLIESHGREAMEGVNSGNKVIFGVRRARTWKLR
jgi:hypothetical protein